MTRRTTLTALFAALLVMAGPAIAQYSAQIVKVDTSAFPKVRLNVVTRNGQTLVRDLDSSRYDVREDGTLQAPLRFSAPEGTGRFSMCALLTNGSTMKSNDFERGRAAILAIIGKMDGVFDEMAIMTYGTTANPNQEMTTVRSSLNTIASTIALSTEANRMWDAIYAALNEVKKGSSKRVMLIITNGMDDGSTNGLASVLQKNLSVNATFYVLGLGMTGVNNDLVQLAQQTGGVFFTNPDLLMQTVVNPVRGTPDWCQLEYVTTNLCRDGFARAVNVLARIAPGEASDDTTYTIAAQASTIVPTVIRIDSGTVSSGKTVTLPVRLITALTNQRFNPATLQLTFDTSKVDLSSVTFNGTLCKDNTFAIIRGATGATIDIGGLSTITGTGVLFNLVFTGKPVQDKVVVPLTPATLTFTRGCIQPTLSGGRLTVQPKSAAITAKSGTIIFEWNAAGPGYDPAVTEVNVEVTNSGDLPVSNLRAVFPKDTTVHIAWGGSDTVVVSPSTLQPGGKGSAKFLVRPVPQATEIISSSDALVLCDEGATANGRMQFVIRAATSALAFRGSADPVSVIGGVYVPANAVVHAHVTSAGTGQSPASKVGITLPTGLSLVSGAAEQSIPALNSGASQTIDWQIAFPPTAVDRLWTITLRLTDAGSMSDTMTVGLLIPALSAPNVVAAAPTGVPAVLTWDSTVHAYTPSPFPLHGSFENSGNAHSDSIFAMVASDLPIVPGLQVMRFIRPLAPGDSTSEAWYFTGPVTPLCTDSLFTIVYTAWTGHPVKMLIQDTIHVLVRARPMLAPEITARVPASADLVISRDSLATFSITAVDPQGEALHHQWVLNGTAVGSDAPSFTQAFHEMQNHVLTCTVSNGCRSVVVTWSFILTGVDVVGAGPAGFGIAGCHPNPFTQQVLVDVDIPARVSDVVTLELLDLTGRVVRSMTLGSVPPGRRQIGLGGLGGASGMHLLRLRAGTMQAVLPVMSVR